MNIFVRTWADNLKLRELFSAYGTVKTINVISGKGFAFVTMPDDAEAQKAIDALNGITVNGERIVVKQAHERRVTANNRNQRRGGGGAANSQNQNVSTPEGPQKKSNFVNPYNFVPVRKIKKSNETLRLFHEDNCHWQDRFREGTHSGRIVCELETESEIFIGAGKIEKTVPAKLVPFELNGKPAIPPSSLKGMLSSIMEAASNSALRVLDNAPYTRRHEFSEILNGIGMVIKRDDGTGQQKKYILPLKTGKADGPRNRNDFTPFNTSTIKKNYPVYLNGYDRTTKAAKGFLKSKDPEDFAANHQFYYLDIRCLKNKIKSRMSRGNIIYFFLGYELKCPQDPAKCSTKCLTNGFPFLTCDEFAALNDPDKDNNFKKGLFKILGVGPFRQSNMPVDKAHEFFLFLEKDPDSCPLSDLISAEKAIKKFNILSDERARKNKPEDQVEAKLPYSPKGRSRDCKDGKDCLKIRTGDIVYYQAEYNNVTQVSFSACWRYFCGDTPQNDVYDYFGTVDANGFLLPPSLENQKKAEPEDLNLTASSALMGFVEEQKQKDKASAFALAGRLFFSPGILSPEHDDPATVRNGEETLKILDSPKPPCPEFYFHEINEPDHFITKKKLKPESCFLPNGRKFYWHHHDETDPYSPNDQYEKDHEKQVSKIEPIKKNTKFLFTIDFFNLTDFEIGMLLYAIRPTLEFRHLIGMGKPIGLGCVKIDILNLLFVDRMERYNNDQLFDNHFFHTQTDTNKKRIVKINEKLNEKDDFNLFEKQRFVANSKNQQEAKYNASYFIQKFKETIESDFLYGPGWLTPLENIGNPVSTEGLIVRYPSDPKDPCGYDEAFKWWVRYY